jgi:hypothetical protein
MTAGRPTKYKEEYCQIMEDQLAKGHSITATTHMVGGVNKSTIYEWKDKHPEFSDSISRGFAKGLQMFEGLLMGKMNGTKKNVDTSCLIFVLKTRFHKEYGEIQKHEVEVSSIALTGDDGKL